jgi:hypothetical protein
MSPKYPRTPHLPWSPGGTSDDRRLASVDPLLEDRLIITEKMDGSNVCLEADACFARSHASTPKHPSFDAFKSFHASVRHLLPEGLQVFGEWLYAKHSIGYSALPHYFLAFGVRDLKTMTWGSWEEVELWAEEIGVPTVPVLGRCKPANEIALKVFTNRLASSRNRSGDQREGIVVRKMAGFSDNAFDTSVAKWVRKNHVQSDDHWKNQAIVRNVLVS